MRFGVGIAHLSIAFIAVNLAMNFVMSQQEMMVVAVLLLVTAILVALMRPLFGFAVIVAELLGIGFFATGTAFYEMWSQPMQLEVIRKMLLFMIATGIIWLLVLETKRLVTACDEMEKQLGSLKKFEEDINVLTLNEFIYRAEAIFVSMKRRQEPGFFVRIKIAPDSKAYAVKPFYEYFSQAALGSIRNQYDLVGKISEYELILFLQNSHKKGAEIVIERFHKVLYKMVNVPDNAYHIDIQPVPESWSQARLLINGGSSLPSRRERKSTAGMLAGVPAIEPIH